MKTRIAFFIILVSSAFAAQSQDKVMLEMLKRDLKAETRAIVAEAMNVAPAKETEFWRVYSEMEVELDALIDKRAGNIQRFAENYTNLTDDVIDDLAKTYFDIEATRLKIFKKYYKRMTKIIGKKPAARFIQIMDQIQLLIDVQIAAEEPLIE